MGPGGGRLVSSGVPVLLGGLQLFAVTLAVLAEVLLQLLLLRAWQLPACDPQPQTRGAPAALPAPYLRPRRDKSSARAVLP